MFFFVPKKYQIEITQQSLESVQNRAIEKGKDLFNLNANKNKIFPYFAVSDVSDADSDVSEFALDKFRIYS